MAWKKATDLTDDELRSAMIHALARLQEQEMVLSELTMIVLAYADEVPTPTDGEYRTTVDQLKEFLTTAYERLKAVNDASERFRADEYAKN
jgi:hypothetical protein